MEWLNAAGDSLVQPGGGATGFLLYEYSLSGKRLELFKQIAPSVTRVAVSSRYCHAGNAQFCADWINPPCEHDWDGGNALTFAADAAGMMSGASLTDLFSGLAALQR